MSNHTAKGEVDLSVVDEMIASYGVETDAAIPILLGLQEAYGYLPMEAMRYVTDKTKSTPDQIYGVATFYGQFRLAPVGEHIVRVCHGTACHVRGAVNITQAIYDTLNLSDDKDTTDDSKYTLEKVACLGCCSLAPVMMIDEKVYGSLNRKKVQRIFKRLAREEAKS
jgi:NADH:ubiquinone oxidoreductase subunit E